MTFIQPSFERFRNRKPDGTGVLEVEGWIEDDKFWARHRITNPELLKSKFYNQKILHILFPHNFPDFAAAGVKYIAPNTPEHGFTIRTLVGHDTSTFGEPRAKETLLGIYRKMFDLSGIFLNLDLSNKTNYCLDNNNNPVYMDTVDVLIKSSDQIPKLLNMAKSLGIDENDERYNNLESYAKRSLANYQANLANQK